MELPSSISSLSNTTYLVKLSDGTELALDLLLFPQFKNLIASYTELEGRIAQKESGRETIQILIDRELYFLKSQLEEVQQAIDSFRKRCLTILEMIGQSQLHAASPLFQGAVSNFLNGNLFEAILALDDPQIEAEAKQSEEHRMRTISYYHLKALACLLVPDVKKAGVYYEKMILISPSTDTYHWYALMLSDSHQPVRALAMEQEALKSALTEIQQATIWEHIGALHATIRNFSQAGSAYEQALMRYASETSDTTAGLLKKQAVILELLGDCVRNLGRRDDAATAYDNALSVYDQLSRSKPGGYAAAIAALQYRKGILANAARSFDQAESHLQHARTVQEKLTGLTDRAAYAQTLQTLGSLYAKARQPQKASALLVQSFETYTALARANPRQYLRMLLETLKLLDSQYVALNQLQAAQTVRSYASRIASFLTYVSIASLIRRPLTRSPVNTPHAGTSLSFFSSIKNLFRRL